MPQLPIVKPRELIGVLEKNGFIVVRQRGSHVRLRHSDGRVVTVPVHSGVDIGRGLLRKVLRDVDMSVEDLLNTL